MSTETTTPPPRILHLRDGGTSLLLDLAPIAGPTVVHWGEELDTDEEMLHGLALAARPQRVTGGIDAPRTAALVATPANGWLGTPGIEGHRAGSSVSILPELRQVDHDERRATLTSDDREAGLTVVVELAVTAEGLVRHRIVVHNIGDVPFTLQSLLCALPVPGDAVEVLDTAGRWLRERAPQRHAFTVGSHVRDSRRGRPGLDGTLLLAVGRAGFGFERGRVHGIHVAWSGSSRVLAERTVEGESFLLGGELLGPGEIILAPGQQYATPEVWGSWGDGLTELSGRFHAAQRASARHPRRPRPVSISTWEAVYFDHDLDRLRALADEAAAIGVERFVLDDGWFRSRRHDRAGLGDWAVDPVVWPHGLHPLVDHVTGLGMEFGLWVEPEMVSADSDLAREHPEWIARARSQPPPLARGQQVLDLTNPAAFAHVAGALRALLTEYPIASLKWDHNRDLMDMASGPGGGARVHEQTLAVYRLIDELLAAHPQLEIETCASGGGRIDLEILSRTHRVWTSDSLDPIERLTSQRYTGLVVPPELLGAHVTAPQVHTSGRHVDLPLSGMVAMFGHFGIECDLTGLDGAQRSELAEWVALAKRLRSLVATGRRVDVDGVDEGWDVRGVVAADGSTGVFTVIQFASGHASPASRVRLPGLDAHRRYRVTVLPITSADGSGRTPLAWAASGIVLDGWALAAVGVRPPVLPVASGVVIEATALT